MGGATAKPRERSLAARVAITFIVPVLVVVVGHRIPLVGISPELAAQLDASTLSLFALGVMPVFSGYWVVEVVAFLVPRLSRLRHENPEGRLKLERAAWVVALVLAAIQAYSLSLTLNSFTGGSGAVSAVSLVVSLVGGVCVQFVLAQFITRQRLMNGFLALLVASTFAETFVELPKQLGLVTSPAPPYALSAPSSTHADASGIVIAGLAISSVVVATWALLRGAGERPWNRPVRPASVSPYRDAQRLALHPEIPLPASSFQAYPFAFALLSLPAALASFHITCPDASRFLANDVSYTITLLALTAIAGWIFARILHRPAELGRLVERLGGKAGPKFEGEVSLAVRAALPPTLLFFATIAMAARASRVGAVSIAILVPVMLDLVHSIRLATREPRFVPIWDERRAAAIPILRAALAGEGIRTEVQGAAVTSFWQVFVPIAPAVLLAPAKDAERARTLLRHLLLGEVAPERAQPGDTVRLPEQPWSPKRRLTVLLLALAPAALAFVTFHVHEATPARTATDGARAKLEVVRIDDSIDPLANVADEMIPEGSGIGVFEENAPLGSAGTKSARFARIALREGESKDAARNRFVAWLAPIALPAGARFGFEEQVDEDLNTKKASVVALRAFVLTGDPVLDSGDVTDAVALEPRDGSSVYVAITLSSAGAKRFEDVTREWTGRRLAIVIDDQIVSAPIIRSVISGGRVSITLGDGDPEVLRERANRLARRLAP